MGAVSSSQKKKKKKRRGTVHTRYTHGHYKNSWWYHKVSKTKLNKTSDLDDLVVIVGVFKGAKKNYFALVVEEWGEEGTCPLEPSRRVGEMETTPLIDGGDYTPARSLAEVKWVFWRETVKVWKIAGPIAFNIICQYGTNSITNIFVGHIGAVELSGVAIALSVIGTFSFGFMVSLSLSLSLFVGSKKLLLCLCRLTNYQSTATTCRYTKVDACMSVCVCVWKRETVCLCMFAFVHEVDVIQWSSFVFVFSVLSFFVFLCTPHAIYW